MIKRIFVWVLLLFSAIQLPAGNTMTDSLLIKLGQTTAEPARIELLHGLATAYMDQELDSALVFIQELHKVSVEVEDLQGQIWSLGLLGKYLDNREDPGSALQAYQDALLLAEELGDPMELAGAERRISSYYLNNGQLAEAKLHLRRAAQSFSQAEGTEKDLNMELAFAFLHQRMDDFDAAEKIYLRLIEAAKQEGNRLNHVRSLANLGHMYKLKGDCELAIETMENCLPMLDGEWGGTAFVHAIMGGCYREKGMAAKGLYHHMQSYEAAVRQNSARAIAESAQDVSLAYEMAGNTQEALRFLRIKTTLMDSLKSLEFVNDKEELEKKYLEERAQRIKEKAATTEQIRQMKRMERQRWVMGGLILGIFFVLLLFWRLTRQNRKEKQVNALLEKTVEMRTRDLSMINMQLSQEIQERKRSESELNTFVYRSSHDIKGPLTSIKGLLSISKLAPEKAELKSYLDMMELKIEHLDDVLERLIEIVRFSERELQPEFISLSRVWKAVLVDLQSIPGFDEVSFEFKGADLEVEQDKESIHIVLRNLAANAIHFRDQEKGTCRCTLEVMKAEEGLALSIRDNGLGMNLDIQDKVRQMFYRGNLRSKGTGLGLFVVEKIISRIGGTLEVQSEEKVGSTLTLHIPS